MTELDDVIAAIPERVVTLCRELRGAGKRGWVVGGCVRDTLRGVPAKDWDVATDARPEEVQRLFRRVVPTGLDHGTVTVLMGDDAFEVTTLRGEGTYVDGRRPEEVVFLDDIEQDLARRDFTFNAIAIDPLEGTLVDPFGGREDLQARVLRAVGVPLERFCEDGLRILRATRFAATLECRVDDATLQAMGEPSALDTLARVSAERVHDEWLKSLGAQRPSIAFSLMRQTRVLPLHAPELDALSGVALEDGADLWDHTMATLDACPNDPVLRLAALLHDLGRPDGEKDHEARGAKLADELLTRLKFSNDDRRRAVHLIRHHRVGDPTAWDDARVRRWLRAVTAERLDDVAALSIANCRGRGVDPEPMASARRALADRARAQLDAGVALSSRDLVVGGKDLMKELGLKPGRHIGELLEELLEAVLDDPALNERERLLELARVRSSG
ncbi:MAG TPA: HD domain-containing protein [Polyangiaceae bacterium]|nr:HD domain-containing protein [Polyangiaceae bacterium]